MAIKKARLNYDNGTDFDTYHYETQTGQVKVYDESNKDLGNLADLKFNGKTMSGANINTLTDTGLYRLINPTGAPISVATDEAYLVDVKSTKNKSGAKVSVQKFIDDSNLYMRIINGGTVGQWINVTDGINTANTVKASVGTLSSLTTTNKTSIVNAVNEVRSATVTNANAIGTNKADITKLKSDMTSHNHDSSYLKLSGGSLTGATQMVNNVAYQGRNASGSPLNLVMIDSSNRTALGNTSSQAIIYASGGNITVSNGTNSYKVWHEGNDGASSGLDADLLDGAQGSSYARKDLYNTFVQDQTIGETKSLVLKGASDSGNSGSIYFRDGSGTQTGRVFANSNGDLLLYGGTIAGHRMKSTGVLESTYNHEFVANSRTVRCLFTRSGDAGVGLYMDTDGVFGMHDYKNGKNIFDVYRSNQVVSFAKNIKIQGKALFIQASAPTGQSTGDVWIDI